MARNQPNDFSDDDTPGSLGANGLTSADMDLTGMGERMTGDTSIEPNLSPSNRPPTPTPAQEAARAAQKTATKSRSSTRSSSDPSPISMAKKRRNQPG